MPYIKQNHRSVLDDAIDNLIVAIQELNNDNTTNPAGNLNYTITRLVHAVYPATSYRNINDAVGVLHCVANEYYRRCAAPYEDQKAVENGDV